MTNTVERITFKVLQDVMEMIGFGLSEQNVQRVMEKSGLSKQDTIASIKAKQLWALGSTIDYSADDNDEIRNPSLSTFIRFLNSIEPLPESQQERALLEKYLDAARKEAEFRGLSFDDDLMRGGWVSYEKRKDQVDDHSAEDENGHRPS